MTDRPIGVHDLVKDMIADRPSVEHWWWCRRHQRAEHVNEPPVTEDPSYPAAAAIDPGCIRIGPFMTEAEAWRLDQNHTHTHEALGMEVER